MTAAVPSSSPLPSPASSSPAALPWLAALAVMVMWASSFVVIRFAGDSFSPGAMSLLRIGAAALVLVPLLLARRVGLPRRPSARAAVIAWGVAWFAAYTIVLNAAELWIDAATAAMLVNLAPLIVAVASGLLLGEGLSARLLTGVLVALGGIALITTATSSGEIAGLGLLLGLLAALLYAGSVLAQKALLRHVDSTSMTVVGIIAGALACLPFAPQLTAELAAAPLGAVLAVVYMGVFPTALAFLLWGFALTRTPAGVLSASSLIVPAITVVLGAAVLGEVPPPLAAVGGVLCLVGAGFAVGPTVLAALRQRDPSRAGTSDAGTSDAGTPGAGPPTRRPSVPSRG